jgi:translation initiation factor 2B subunit (eIF-2B alpha/beta/delta family)
MLTIEDISKKLSQGELAVFIGAGVSRKYKNLPGIPSAGELIDIFASKFSYIKNDSQYIDKSLRFENACKKIKNTNGERELISIIMKEVNNPIIRPLPAHTLLAKLPFSSYFSTNWDTLLETACTNVSGHYPVIYEDKHVALLKNADTPIIKLHGCISNPDSIVATIDDYKPFKENKPLIDAITKVNLASKTILFLGYTLKDSDFNELYNDLYSILGQKYMGRHMAIIVEPSDKEISDWENKGITLVNHDLTDFLNELASTSKGCNDLGSYHIKSIYLKELHNVTDCPTETIATDVFLEILRKELKSGISSVGQIVTDFESGYKAVLDKKPNFCAFESECKEILTELKKHSDIQVMLNYIEGKIAERDSSSRAINKYNTKVVKRSDSILIYSQSVRVTKFLESLTSDYQQSCTLYISECRAKCPIPFYDANQISKSLVNTGYRKLIVTDSSITYLMKTNQITKVLMGAHAVYMKEGKMVKFVNTSGSDMILKEAQKYSIPIYIIAEEKKCKIWDDNEGLKVSYLEEKKLITKSLENEGIETLEVAYDLCDSNENVFFVCGNGVI